MSAKKMLKEIVDYIEREATKQTATKNGYDPSLYTLYDLCLIIGYRGPAFEHLNSIRQILEFE